ncbi:hypothetical protein VdG1_03846 [Verticillium dahliae VDG1]|nr:hypothetical protein VdG1_03846 [Verticillium dahliae VDG1]
MDSPFPKSSSAPGEGRIVARLLPNGQPGFESITYQYPLKLISPSLTAGEKSALVFLLSYGGGLVGGDHVHLEILVRPDARLSIVTQGHTKIFKAASKTIVTRQALRARIAAHAGLCLLPDPVQPFDDSRTSALTGRPLRGSMHGHGVFGSLLLRGPQMQRLGEFFLAEFGRLPRLGARDFRTVEAREKEETDRSTEDSWRLQRLAMEKQHAVLWSAASVRGCVVVKFGAATVEGGRVWIAHMLSREGSITELYGDQAMICLR